MRLIDTNLLVYAYQALAPERERAAAWLQSVLDGNERVGLPWTTLLGFVRLMTHPRIVSRPLKSQAAWDIVDTLLDQPNVWIPAPGDEHRQILRRLFANNMTSKLAPDAHLAALALEHGLILCSADSDFARFSELRWENPLAY